MEGELELHIHYLCPYAQRALYVSAFKNLSPQIIEQSLAIKSESLYAINPLGKVPSLKFTTQNKSFNLYESQQVCEFLDSYPGPSLYLHPSSQITKSLIDMNIRLKISPFVNTFVPFWWSTPSESDKIRAQKWFSVINTQLKGGRFFMAEEVADVVTMADVFLYPFIERIWALKESFLKEMVSGVHVEDTWAWLKRMEEFEWIQRYKAPEHRLRNLIALIKEKRYPGLDLPVTIYD